MDETTKSELRTGLAETKRYLLSHHTPDQYHRCYTLRMRGRTVRLCARCLGIYPGIAVGFAVFVFGLFGSFQLLLVATLPMPALVDWTVTHLYYPDGRNRIRTVTGVALGVGYGLGVGHLLVGREPLVLAVGACYGALSALSLVTDRCWSRS